MIDVEPLIVSGLDRLVPLPSGERADWQEVLQRAGVERRRRLTPRRLALVLVAVAAAAAVAVATPVGSAIVRGLGDFSDWLTGHPGKPASPAEQRAFEQAKRSWLSFPKETDLRRLIETRVDGTTYVLNGFRAGDSLCLRLTAAGEARGGPLLSCAPFSELRARKEPVLVVFVDDGFGSIRGKHVHIGPDTYTPVRAAVSAGIVADGVKAIELAGEGGRRERATVAGNSFLAVVPKPKVGSRTRRVWATTTGGRQIAIPFAQSPFGTFGFPAASARKPLGPAKIERRVHGGRIGWLERRELRGAPVPPKRVDRFYRHFGRVVFERLLTPEPNSLLKVVVTLQLGSPPGTRQPKTLHVCDWLVAGGTTGGSCNSEADLFTRQPFTAGETVMGGGDQYGTIDGLASDEVARLELFLSSRSRSPAAARPRPATPAGARWSARPRARCAHG